MLPELKWRSATIQRAADYAVLNRADQRLLK